MTVAFRELAGSPVETYGPEGLEAERVLLCAWDDREEIVEQLLGDGYEYGGSGQAHYPGKPDILAVRARCEPFTDDVAPQVLSELTEGLNRYNGFAKVTVDYELLVPADRGDAPEVEPGTFLTYRQDTDFETLPLSADSWSWEDEPEESVPATAVPIIRVPLIVHQFTWHRVLSPPWEAIRSCVGTVNSEEFLGAAPGCVLLDGSSAQREFISFDDLARPDLGWRIGYVFRERAIKTASGQIVGWNHTYRSLPVDDPGWDRLSDANGNRPYQSSDFQQLFQFRTQ